jgi:hypothetical protein
MMPRADGDGTAFSAHVGGFAVRDLRREADGRRNGAQAGHRPVLGVAITGIDGTGGLTL